MSQTIQMSLNISPELAEKLEEMSKTSHDSIDRVLTKAIYLMEIAIDSKKHGNKIAVLNNEGKKVSEIRGV